VWLSLCSFVFSWGSPGVLLGLPGFSWDFREAALDSLGAFIRFRYLIFLNDFEDRLGLFWTFPRDL
jgi:hypothetical protein